MRIFGKKDGPAAKPFNLMDLIPLLMKYGGKFAGANGNYKPPVTELVKEFATDANITMVADAIHNGLWELQSKQQTAYMLTFNSNEDYTDEVITIYTRTISNPVPVLYQTIYLSKITQADIINLLNIIFDGLTARQQQLTAGATAGLLSSGQ